MNPNPSDSPIRITHEEATSKHVDDLLKRQTSMRGEPGVTRDRGRSWYYQNWFVFALVGLFGALAAWGALEPLFDDMIYYQGKITALDPLETGETVLHRRGRALDLPVMGSVTINDQKILVLRTAKEIKADGSHTKLKVTSLRLGEPLGIYLQHEQVNDEGVSVGFFGVRSPPPQSPGRAAMTIDQLEARSNAASLILFPLVAGLIGLFIGAADGLICRLPRRALLCGVVGLLVGLVGGFVTNIIANIVYAPLTALAMRQGGDGPTSLTTFGFLIQMGGRSFAWCLAGMAMGLGQGIALRSGRLLFYGLIGGVVGGLLGGLLFDPIDLLLLGPDKPSAHWSRLIGFGVIGLAVGGMIGVVELLARDAWLRMTQGPLTGKEFLLFKDVMNIGSSPRSDIYLFNDSLVAADHAVLRAVGDECEIEARHHINPILLNNRSVVRARLRHGDNVTVGRTVFVFQRRKG